MPKNTESSILEKHYYSLSFSQMYPAVNVAGNGFVFRVNEVRPEILRETKPWGVTVIGQVAETGSKDSMPYPKL